VVTSGDRILVVGAGGFLGRALCGLETEGFRVVPALRVIRPPYAAGSAHQLDITSADRVDDVIRQVDPAWVINTAAMTSVDGCETQPEQARRIHVEGTRNLVRACKAQGSGLMSLSTNYVFDGTAGPYSESDRPNPLNVYGRSKLEGESIVLDADCPGIVVRTAVLYGHREGCRPNFVTWAASSLARGEAIRVVTDECANPTYVDELAGFLLAACRSDFRGVVHFAGADHLSRYDMVIRMCACYGLDPGLVSGTTSAEFKQPARRPLSAGLKVALAARIAQDDRRPFTENLEGMRRHLAHLWPGGGDRVGPQ